MKRATLQSAKPRRRRINDPDGTRRDIIDVATKEFASKGFSGARVDDIAAKTRTSKRMIYYYFGGKGGLYIAVLEAAYREIRSIEGKLDLHHQDPQDALRTLVSFTFDYQNEHPQFVRLVMNENILDGAYVARSKIIKQLNSPAIEALGSVLLRGQRSGVFRSDVDPVDLHMTISALAFFNVGNRATFSRIFERDMSSRRALAARRSQVIETVLRYVCRP